MLLSFRFVTDQQIWLVRINEDTTTLPVRSLPPGPKGMHTRVRRNKPSSVRLFVVCVSSK